MYYTEVESYRLKRSELKGKTCAKKTADEI